MSCYITYKGKNYTQEDFLDFLKSQIPTKTFTWARRAENSYEVSSKGDTRFSALNAKLKDGRTIEEAYQLDVKGYRAQGDNWRLGKGKAPLTSMTKEQTWQAYKNLWRQFLEENPTLEQDLRNKASGKVLTDMFASTDISQARALAELLNERKSPLSTLNNPAEFTNHSVVESQQVSQPTKVDIRAKVYELFNLQGYMDIKTSHKTDKNLITAISHYVLEDLGYKTDQEKLQVVREGFKLSEYITTEQISDVHTRVRLNMKNIIEDEVDDGPVSLGGIKFTSSGYESDAKNAFTCK